LAVGDLAWSVGNVTVTRVVENEVPLPLGALIPEATPEALLAHRAWLEPHFLDASGGTVLSIHGLVVESAGRRILVDTCAGKHAARGYEALIEGGKPFLTELERAGFPPATIDTVVCTHMHFDHVGWNTHESGGKLVPSFPRARYLFARAEWEHWSAEGQSGYTPTLDDAVRPIVDAGLADLVASDHAITPEVRLVPSPGHTPGHVCVAIESDGARALITGDATHHPVQWAEIDWKMSADTDSAQAAASRRRLRAEAADRPVLVIGTHYAAPCAGHVVTHGAGFAFRALR
jgi:glyoxylase-like metal-dependent hydrolase (beta-lactamase superfamily II)